MGKRVNLDNVDKFHDYSLYIPSRTIYMGSESYEIGSESGVDGLMAERFLKNLHVLENASAEPITVIMNNPGGDWYHGMGIYDAIKSSRCPITIRVKGMAMSMGAVILQAADKRIISPNSRFMIHYGYMGMEFNHTKIFKKWADETEKVDREMERIFLNKIQEKHAEYTIEKLREMLNFDTILSAKQTVAIGLADELEEFAKVGNK